jgi:hypothetical protein
MGMELVRFYLAANKTLALKIQDQQGKLILLVTVLGLDKKITNHQQIQI